MPPIDSGAARVRAVTDIQVVLVSAAGEELLIGEIFEGADNKLHWRGEAPDKYHLGKDWHVELWLQCSRNCVVSVDHDAIDSNDEIIAIAETAVRCEIAAYFEAQVWIDDYALRQDDGHSYFNAAPAIAQLDSGNICRVLRGRDLDFLAEGLPARIAHNGPFNVSIDRSDVVRLITLLAGGYKACDPESNDIDDIPEEMMQDGLNLLKKVISIKRLAGCPVFELTGDTDHAPENETTMGGERP